MDKKPDSKKQTHKTLMLFLLKKFWMIIECLLYRIFNMSRKYSEIPMTFMTYPRQENQPKKMCEQYLFIVKQLRDGNTCLLRNLFAGHEATVRIGHGILDWFQIGKGVCQGCILSPYLFNLYTVHQAKCQAE